MTDSPRAPLAAPVRGERYAAVERLSSLIAPPYDVIGDEEREALAARDQRNIVHVMLPPGKRDRYQRAARLLTAWRDDGTLVRDETPSVYVVQQEFVIPDGRTCVRTGVVAGIHVEPYEQGRVRPHERTHRGPREDRLELMRATATMVETIFFLARDERDRLKRRLDGVTRHEPLAVAELDGVAVGLWRVGGAQAAEIIRAVGDDAVYIADGHHRFETAVAYRAENPRATHIPGLIVPVGDPGLVVQPTHRLIHGGALPIEVLIERWKKDFAVEEREAEFHPGAILTELAARGPACVVALPNGRILTVVLDRREAMSDGELEISVVEKHVVTPLAEACGGNPVTYSAYAGEVFDLLGRGQAAAAVLVHATPVEAVLSVADAGGIMPPKSTYFAPKMPAGLVLLPAD